MSNDRFKGLLPSIDSRRLGGILCVVLLHLGAWYWIALESPKTIRTPPVARASSEIIVRFYDSPPLRASSRMEAHEVGHKADRISMPALEKRDATTTQLPPVTQIEIEPGESKEARSASPLPDEPTATGTQEASSSLIESEKVRKVIVDIAAEEQRKENASTMMLGTHRSAAEKAISQAARPKCENGDAIKAGNAQFTGLMKLPLLMLGAVRDKGCKW